MPSNTRAHSRADQKLARLSRILCAAVAAMCTTVASAEVRVLTWSPVDASVESDLTSMVSAYPGSNPRTIAAELTRRPAGKRALLYLNSTGILGTHPADACRAPDDKRGTTLTTWPGPWTNSGARDLLATSTAFFQALRAEGAMVDLLILDEEYDFSAGRYIRADNKNMDAIQADPRFAAIAKRLGFRDLRKVMWGTPEYHRWNEVLLADFDAALERSVVAPFRALWPSATVSNDRSAPIARRFMTPDSAGHGIIRGGRGVGTHNSIEFYGMVLRWLNGAPFANTRLNDGACDLLRMNVHKLRGATATNGKPMMPWSRATASVPARPTAWTSS
jgi:hypothetical protein